MDHEMFLDDDENVVPYSAGRISAWIRCMGVEVASELVENWLCDLLEDLAAEEHQEIERLLDMHPHTETDEPASRYCSFAFGTKPWDICYCCSVCSVVDDCREATQDLVTVIGLVFQT